MSLKKATICGGSLTKTIDIKIMATPKNHGKPVTPAVVKQIEELASKNTPTGLIAYKTGRTENSIYKIASDNDISLHPTNQSPYNRTK